MKKLLLFVLLLVISGLHAQTAVILKDSITGNVHLTADKLWEIQGFLYVVNGATLTIDPGTIIVGDKATAGTLIVERGGKIMAQGSAQRPIVFTSKQPPGARASGDWGGIILCGRAPINVNNTINGGQFIGGEAQIEGGPRSKYGGNQPSDNSGVLSYVRIEFSGIAISPNNETNGLTLSGVGSGTQIDHVQVSYGGDDGIEWFGGTVNAKYLVNVGSLDDDWDTDFGWQGKVQFGVSLRDPNVADVSKSNGFEADNNNPPTFAQPRSRGIFSNMTVVGPQSDTSVTTFNSLYGNAVHHRRNTQQSIHNSIIMGWPGVLLLDGSGVTNAADNDTMQIRNVIVAGAREGKTYQTNSGNTFDVAAWLNEAVHGNRVYAQPADAMLEDAFNLTAPNWKPKAGSPAASGASFTSANLQDPFFTPTTYVGAFDPAASARWDAGWTEYNPKQKVFAPKLSVSYTSVNFGLVGNGEFVENSDIEITNTGNAPLEVSNFAISGTNALEFTIVSGGANTALAPGAKLKVTIKFQPAGIGEKLATLSFTHNDALATSPKEVTIFGKGINPFAGDILKDSVTGNVTLTNDRTYLIRGFVYVVGGATLNIEPGTVLYGEKSTKGTIIVERGGKIIADGSECHPIVMTSQEPPGQRSNGDWGGLIICGRAPINVNNTLNGGQFVGGETQVEGGPRSKYGGNDPNDNSGVLRYVRIEFSGIALSPNNETNSLTMAGVGSGTIIDHVQASFGGDDAFEWFGGTVSAKHLVSIGALDDVFDTDFGWSGNVQFAVNLSDPNIADVSASNGFESDNNNPPTFAQPRTKGVFSNVTLAGPLPEVTSTANSQFGNALHIRRNSQLNIFNSVFMGWPGGILMDGSGVTNGATNDTVKISNCILAGIPAGKLYKTNSGNAFNTENWFKTASHGNREIATSAEVMLDNPFALTSPNWTPKSGSPAETGALFADSKLQGSFFMQTTYVGAFDPAGPRWDECWSNYDPKNTVYAPIAGLGASSVDFGAVAVSMPKEQTATGLIKNTGTVTLRVTKLELSGVNAGDFQVVSPAVPFSVLAGESRDIQLKFTPGTEGSRSATLTITHNAGTEGGGTLLVNLTGMGTTSSVRGERSASGVVLAQSVPNPAKSSATISFELPKQSQISLELIDVTGRTISSLANGSFAGGEHEVVIDTRSLPEGVYLYRLMVGSESLVKNLIVLR